MSRRSFAGWWVPGRERARRVGLAGERARRGRGSAQRAVRGSATELVEGVAAPGRPEPLQVGEQPTGHRRLGRGPGSGPNRLRAQRHRGHPSIVRASRGRHNAVSERRDRRQIPDVWTFPARSGRAGVRAAPAATGVALGGTPVSPGRRGRAAPPSSWSNAARRPSSRSEPSRVAHRTAPKATAPARRSMAIWKVQHDRSSPSRSRRLAGRDERLAPFRPGSPPAGPAPGTPRSG